VARLWHAGFVDPQRMRASDGDREAAAERLRAALYEGRLDLTEYDERLQGVYGARTYGDLSTLLCDLPGPAPVEHSTLMPLGPSALGPSVPGGSAVAPPGRLWATFAYLAPAWSAYAVAVVLLTAIAVLANATAAPGEEVTPLWPTIPVLAGFLGAIMSIICVGVVLAGVPQKGAERARERSAASAA
jgi:Domain of unknown function (DUF1707)